MEERQLPLLELLLGSRLAPVSGYLGRADADAACAHLQTTRGDWCPVPPILDVSADWAASRRVGERIALRHPEGFALAILTVSEVWQPDWRMLARDVLGSNDESDRDVFDLVHVHHPMAAAGSLEPLDPLTQRMASLRPDALACPVRGIWRTRQQQRWESLRGEEPGAMLVSWEDTIASGDKLDAATRLQATLSSVGAASRPSFVPEPPRSSPLRFALALATMLRNAGFARVCFDAELEPLWTPLHRPDLSATIAAAQRRLARELGIEMRLAPPGAPHAPGTPGPAAPQPARSEPEIVRAVRNAAALAGFDIVPVALACLQARFPPPATRGVAVFLTGLSGAGKSTIAQRLVARIRGLGTRAVTLLDGDIVRKLISSELGYSRPHRDLNILRIGFIAQEIVRHGGMVVCAPIAPYRATRRRVRQGVEAFGDFVEVHVATPLDVCEQRDPKGLYARARSGALNGFTGIDDPYEPPDAAEIVIDTSRADADACTQAIVDELKRKGYL
jgi:sulfate adenylyltransferase